MFALEKDVFALEKGVFALEKGVLALEKGVPAREMGVVALEKCVFRTRRCFVHGQQQARQLTPRRGTVAHLGNRGCCVHIHTGNLSGCVGKGRVYVREGRSCVRYGGGFCARAPRVVGSRQAKLALAVQVG